MERNQSLHANGHALCRQRMTVCVLALVAPIMRIVSWVVLFPMTLEQLPLDALGRAAASKEMGTNRQFRKTIPAL